MRIIQYPMTLRQGYCLFNCPDADDGESYGNPVYPGIHMKVIKCSDDQDIIDMFGFMTDKGHPDFEEHWRETLRGENTLWKIVRVVINSWHIYLQFASEHFCHDNTEFMSMDTTSLRATLQFEVSHSYDPGTDIIEVELRGQYGIAVTETDGSKKRKFEIHPPIEKEDFDNFYTIVTEYM